MTSIDFLNKVHKCLDSQEYNLSYSPAKSKNYMLYCNGNFIGGLFDEELCFVYADSVSKLLDIRNLSTAAIPVLRSIECWLSRRNTGGRR